MSETLTVRASLRAYTVHFVDDVRPPLRAAMGDDGVAVCDAAVYALYRSILEPVIPEDRCVLVEAVEANKTLETCKDLIERLVARRFRRTHSLIAVGGGIIQDLVGFVATVLYRGVEWIFVPTTLLAQADSCLGSKSSINLGEKKNLIGSFYPPAAVHIDVRFLDTLSVDDVRSGIGEIMHFYLYADSPLRASLGEEYPRLLRHRADLRPHIHESLRIKQRVVEVDEFDRGERHKFNYGHTFGHALESVTDYAIKHGLAVTVGMDLANYLSMHLGLLERGAFEEMHAWLAVNFPAYDWTRMDLDRYMVFLAADRKNVGDDLTCILAAGPGHLVVRRVPLDGALREWIDAYFCSLAVAAVPGKR